MSVTVRRWTRDDLPAVRQLLLETWLDAYSPFIARKDLVGYLDAHYSPSQLKALFVDPAVTGLVAVADGAISGYAKLYHPKTERRFSLHQLYVLPPKQGHGLGRRLMIAAEDRAREFGADRIWLGVMVKNIQAVNWYKKLGYTVTETSPFVMGASKVDHYIGYLLLPLPNLPRR
jgi:ribosomal protein S18 acetylase RimI-like enzyme